MLNAPEGILSSAFGRSEHDPITGIFIAMYARPAEIGLNENISE
jgi:hypothetical protein